MCLSIAVKVVRGIFQQICMGFAIMTNMGKLKFHMEEF